MNKKNGIQHLHLNTSGVGSPPLGIFPKPKRLLTVCCKKNKTKEDAVPRRTCGGSVAPPLKLGGRRGALFFGEARGQEVLCLSGEELFSCSGGEIIKKEKTE